VKNPESETGDSAEKAKLSVHFIDDGYSPFEEFA
jgi:hypothetical protein